ncbi:hypothetical protein LLG95_00185 [bacterium]|nr:hypothetical protein [bacterium]
MGVDLVLRGKRGWSLKGLFARQELLIDRANNWLQQDRGKSIFRIQHYRDTTGKLHIQIYLHPLDFVEFTAEGKNVIQIYAKTSPLGAGYHRYLCDLLKRMGTALDLTWEVLEDDTGYFCGGDSNRIEDLMLQWLGAAVQHMRQVRAEGTSVVTLNMNMDEDFDFKGILTPMGPRDDAWLERAAANPQLGTDIFPWWDFDLHRAFKSWAESLMWNEIRWRKPLNKDESVTMGLACAWLEKAFEKYPNLTYPWREWLQVMDLCGWKRQSNRAIIEQNASRCEGPLIGYRRRDVTFLKIRPWSIRLPGSFGDGSESGENIILNDETRRVLITAFRTAENFEPGWLIEKHDPATIAEKLEFNTDTYKSEALIFNQPDDAQMQSVSYAGKHALICTYVHPPEDRQWAIDTWHSIKFSEKQPTWMQESFGEKV